MNTPGPAPAAATPEPSADPRTDFQRFTDAARQVFNVPKAAVDKPSEPEASAAK